MGHILHEELVKATSSSHGLCCFRLFDISKPLDIFDVMAAILAQNDITQAKAEKEGF